MHAYRVLDFCIRFAKNGFMEFKDAITYQGNQRIFMLNIKNGIWKHGEFLAIMNEKANEFCTYEEKYKQQKPNEETKEKLYCLVKNLVRKNI